MELKIVELEVAEVKGVFFSSFSGRKEDAVLVFEEGMKNVFDGIDIIDIHAIFIVNMGSGAGEAGVFIEGCLFGFLDGDAFVRCGNKHFVVKLFELSGFISAEVEEEEGGGACRRFGSSGSRLQVTGSRIDSCCKMICDRLNLDMKSIYKVDLAVAIEVEFAFGFGPEFEELGDKVFDGFPYAKEDIVLFDVAAGRCSSYEYHE